ncbi:carbohydrate-binding protein [Flavobacterium nackdongense]|nr:carbohydrate-binding protein [Flavobacterium nackdongense]
MKKIKLLLFFMLSSVISTSVYSQISAPSKVYFLCESPFTNLNLFWQDNSNNESGFVIESKLDGGNWETWETINSANVTSYNRPNYSRTESREFRVIAFNGSETSPVSNSIRVVGTSSTLEVSPEIPGIRNPKSHTISGVTFSEIQDQCPADPSKGKATRISTYFSVEVRKASESTLLNTPVYETRSQIRNYIAQNDPQHTGGHRPYAWGNYGPSSNSPSRVMHSRHWTNIDGAENIVVRIKLLPTRLSAHSSNININDLQIMPTPLNVNLVDDTTVDVTLAGATSDYALHYRIAFNRQAWTTASGRDPNTAEAPLFIFMNPISIAPASAPENEFKEFNGGALIVMGAGIHLPNNRWRFFGSGENSVARELYAPGDAYLHGGFVFNEDTYQMKAHGRAIYSDEFFNVFDIETATGYEYSSPGRTPWSKMTCTQGNVWNITPPWEARVAFSSTYANQTLFEGFTNIGGRMGPVMENGRASMINHKDVGYTGSTYQRGNGIAGAIYKGCLLHNEDDVTYTHPDYLFDHCTTYNLVNGPTFQLGWSSTSYFNALATVKNHTVFESDRKAGTGNNHGVWNAAGLGLNTFTLHTGGYWEDVTIWGEQNIVWSIKILNNATTGFTTTPIIQDKTWKNVTVEFPSRSKNLLQGNINSSLNQVGYLKFFHFDNLVIAGKRINNIDDGNHFTYNAQTLLHTFTFFSLPNQVISPTAGISPNGQAISMFNIKHKKFVKIDESLPVSLSPACANSSSNASQFTIVDAGNGYVALQASNGYYLKADANRYGYIHSLPDLVRGDVDTQAITDSAKFIWVNVATDQFALYSKTMGLYVRTESNSGPNLPLYAASNSIGEAETFSSNSNIILRTITASASGSGTISPNNTVSVIDGTDQTFTFTPGAGSTVNNVIVDNVSIGKMNSYTFTNVTTDHTIKVDFNTVIPSLIQAENFSAMFGVQTQTTTDSGGGLNVGFIGAGDWMDYEVFVPQTGTYNLDFRIAGTNATWSFDILSNNNLLKTVTGINTGGFQVWSTLKTTIDLTAGQQTIRVYAKASGWNFNWMEFTTSSLGNDAFTKDQIIVYPNPVENEVFITNIEGDFSFKIFDLTGKNIIKGNHQTSGGIDVSKLNKGTYLLEISDNNNLRKTVKILKN